MLAHPQVVQDLGTADIDARLEELLIDGILYAFQEQVRAPWLPLWGNLSTEFVKGACCRWAHGRMRFRLQGMSAPGRSCSLHGFACLLS